MRLDGSGRGTGGSGGGAVSSHHGARATLLPTTLDGIDASQRGHDARATLGEAHVTIVAVCLLPGRVYDAIRGMWVSLEPPA